MSEYGYDDNSSEDDKVCMIHELQETNKRLRQELAQAREELENHIKGIAACNRNYDSAVQGRSDMRQGLIRERAARKDAEKRAESAEKNVQSLREILRNEYGRNDL